MFDFSQYIPVVDFDEFKALKCGRNNSEESTRVTDLDILNLISVTTIMGSYSSPDPTTQSQNRPGSISVQASLSVKHSQVIDSSIYQE